MQCDRLMLMVGLSFLRSEERFSRNAETVLGCGLLLERKKVYAGFDSLSFYHISYTSYFFFHHPATTHNYTLSLHGRSSDLYNYPKKKGIKDECSRLLEASTMKSRRGFAIQRLMNAMRQAHADGWFIVFDTLTLADDRLEAFYDNPNALRDYFRDIGRM